MELNEYMGDLPHHLSSDLDVQEILSLKDDKAQKVVDSLDEVHSL